MYSGTRENNKIEVQTVLLDTLYNILVACCSRSHILYKVLNAQFVNVGVLGEVEVQSGSLLSLTLLLGYIQPRPQQLCGPVSNVWMVAGGWNALMS